MVGHRREYRPGSLLAFCPYPCLRSLPVLWKRLLKLRKKSLKAIWCAASETLEGASTACKDETGTLLTFLARMIEGLKTLVRQVQHSGIQVTASATRIAASARQLEATVAEQAASTTEVSASHSGNFLHR